MVTAAEVRPLRAAILRPGRPPDAVVWPGDDDPRAGHYVVRGERGEVLAIGSVVPASLPDGRAGWRVRGMATDPAARGRGLGAAILAALLDHAREEGAALVWCHARERAVPLYERAGFRVTGEPYELPGIGPHRLLVRSEL